MEFDTSEAFPVQIPDLKANQYIRQVALCNSIIQGNCVNSMQKQSYQINPQDEKWIGKRQGQVIVIEDRCKGCGFCIAAAPARFFRVSSVFNKKGYHPPRSQ